MAYLESASMPSGNIINALRLDYPVGCTVVLDKMDDPYRSMPAGLKGKVIAVDDAGTIHVQWENGSTLGAAYGEDKVHRFFQNTRIEYLYRDACNYKCWNNVVVKGVFSEEQVREIRACCIDGNEEFIPGQVGWDLLRGWDVTEDDVCTCELQGFTGTDDAPTVDMTAEDVIRRFRECENNWNFDSYAPEQFGK